MERFQRILLYADPAAKIEPALRYAARVARHNQGAVTVVDCMRNDSPPDYLEFDRDCPQCVQLAREQRELGSVARQETRARLDKICEQLHAHGAPATAKILVGQTTVEIIREVLRSGHDVVMKTAQGDRKHKEQAFFGTTAIALMRKCPCPVWVVDPDETDRFDCVMAAVDPMTDDSEHARLNGMVLDLATDLAEWEGGKLHVVHAWTPHGVSVLSSRMPEESLKRYTEGGRKHAEHRMADLLAKFGQKIAPHNVHLLPGDPAQAIPDFASQRGIDLIVIGTVGRTGISGFVMGNTAEKVLRRVRCSVLAVKPDTFISPVKVDDLGRPRRHKPETYQDFAEPRLTSSIAETNRIPECVSVGR